MDTPHSEVVVAAVGIFVDPIEADKCHRYIIGLLLLLSIQLNLFANILLSLWRNYTHNIQCNSNYYTDYHV